jgi:hypothetical protein
MANLIWSSNFETGTLSDIFDVEAGDKFSLVTAGSGGHPSVRSGGSGTKLLYYDTTAGSNVCAADIGNRTEVFLRFWWYIPSGITGGVSGRHTFRITRRANDNYTYDGQLDTEYDATGNDFGIVWFDGLEPLFENSTEYNHLGALPQDQWFKMEVWSKLGTPGASNGAIGCWVNGSAIAYSTAEQWLTDEPPTSRLKNGFNTYLPSTNYDGGNAHWWIDDVEIYDGVPAAGGAIVGSAPVTFSHTAVLDGRGVRQLASVATISFSHAGALSQPSAPAIVFTDGFETNTIAAPPTGNYYEIDSSGLTRSTADHVGGAYGLRHVGSANSAALWVGFGKLPTNMGWPAFAQPTGVSTTELYTDITVSFYHWTTTWSVPSGNWEGNLKLLRLSVFAASSGAQASALHLWTDSTGTRLLVDPVRGTGALSSSTLNTTGWNDTANFAWLSASKGTCTTQVYSQANIGHKFLIAVRMKLNTPGVADGLWELWIDGVKEVERTGIDWRGSYTTYGINTVHFERYWNTSGDSSDTSWFDDIQIKNNLATEEQPDPIFGTGSIALSHLARLTADGRLAAVNPLAFSQSPRIASRIQARAATSSTFGSTAALTTASTTYALIQEGHQFRLDDGDETTATYIGAQDSTIQMPLGSRRRIRVLVDSISNPQAHKFRLEYKRSTDSTYSAVRLGSGAIQLSDSPFITGGQATTAQLNPPSGKTTANFFAGKVRDDANGVDQLNLGADEYTELEWCVIAQSPAVKPEVYQLRVTRA